MKGKSQGKVCCVPGCPNTQKKNPSLSFYSFPNRDYETVRKKLWIVRVRRKGDKNGAWVPTKHTRICAEHFVGGVKSNNPTQENFNPTIFPWNPANESFEARRQRLVFCNEKKNVNLACKNEDIQMSQIYLLSEIRNMEGTNKDLNSDIKIRSDLFGAGKVGKIEEVKVKIEEVNVKIEDMMENEIAKENGILFSQDTQNSNTLEETRNIEQVFIKEEPWDYPEDIEPPVTNSSKDNVIDEYGQFLVKYKNTIDGFCVKKEITEELIKIEEAENSKTSNDSQLLVEEEDWSEYSSTTQNGFQLKSKSPTSEICQKSFKYLHELKNRELFHSNKLFACDVCPKKFTRNHTLVKHKLNHNQEKSFACDVCPKKFSGSHQLTIHKRFHTAEKVYECDVCPKKFKTKNHLLNHKSSHTEEKPYECDVCPKKYKAKQQLLIHKRIHTGENPYECDVCQKKFRRVTCLAMHKISHSGEKPFACNMCQKAFASTSGLRYHQNKNH